MMTAIIVFEGFVLGSVAASIATLPYLNDWHRIGIIVSCLVAWLVMILKTLTEGARKAADRLCNRGTLIAAGFYFTGGLLLLVTDIIQGEEPRFRTAALVAVCTTPLAIPLGWVVHRRTRKSRGEPTTTVSSANRPTTG